MHIIPYDAIGGVESAARSLPSGRYGGIRFQKYFLVRSDDARDEEGTIHGPRSRIDRPSVYWKALSHVLAADPELVICSLWRSAIVLLVLKVLRPKVQLALFLHLATDVHLVDRLVNRMAMSLADKIWVDSEATLQARVPRRLRRKGRVISFLLEDSAAARARDPKPEFIFWGRLTAQKNLKRSLDLFARIAERLPNARFRIIGPDGGQEGALRKFAETLNLKGTVHFLGPMDLNDIKAEAEDAAFYLQTSDFEGMAISVVEAMQEGLVPVVTPVGEIARYCTDRKNAVLVKDDAQATSEVVNLLEDLSCYREMSNEAWKYWQGRPLYREDIIGACFDALGL